MASPSASPVDISAAMVTAPAALADWLVILPVAWCLGVGALLLVLRKSIRLQAELAIGALGLLAVMNLLLLLKVIAGGPVTMTMGRWLPPFGISFTVDALGAFFAFTSALVALAAAFVARGDVDASGRRYGFYPFMLLLMAGVSGAFLTGDVFNLYVWFEVLLISSFGLLVLGSTREQIDGATKYAFLNLVATTLFLITTGYLYGLFGTLNMADIAVKAETLRATAPLMTLATLYLLAFGMKAAAFPVNFWLPASYHTPKLVVSALFGGLLTKVGIYALLRTLVMLFPLERHELSPVIAAAAALTMILGVVGALAQDDLRRTVGFLVVSGIGVMMAGLALGSPGGVAGAVLYAAHSMVVMAALYFAVGLGARLAGSFRLSETGGIYASSAALSFATLALLLSVAGLPPFSGLWPKVMLVKAALDVGAWWLAGAILVTGLMTTLVAGRVFALAHWRPAVAEAAPATLDRGAVAGLAALTLLSLVFGLWPEPVIDLSRQAATGLLDPSAYILSVFPGEVPR